ncbi:MAG: PIN domain-containing protein [Nanoarchaeota archaeon]
MNLFDTCAIIHLFENNKEEELLDSSSAVCSFNRDELTKVTHRHSLNIHLKHTIRKFFQEHKIKIIEVPVIPGQREQEKEFVNSVEPELLRLIPDPSDAVLAACAFENRANIVTRDRHHLYTARLENLFNKFNIKVEKKL